MKVKATELAGLVREIVRDELRKALPGAIRECLTERYLRRLVSEQRGGGLAEVLEPEEETPRPLPNPDRGIYGRNPLVRGGEEDEEDDGPSLPAEATKLLGRENPLSFIYEGVAPAPKNPMAGAPNNGRGVPIEKMGGDFGRMRELLHGMEQRTVRRPASAPAAPVARPDLDRVVDTRPADQRQQQPSWVTEQARRDVALATRRATPNNSHPAIDGEVFPSAPIVLDD